MGVSRLHHSKGNRFAESSPVAAENARTRRLEKLGAIPQLEPLENFNAEVLSGKSDTIPLARSHFPRLNVFSQRRCIRAFPRLSTLHQHAMKHQLYVLTLTTTKLVRNYQRAKDQYQDRLREYQDLSQPAILIGALGGDEIAREALENASRAFYQSEHILKIHWTHLWQHYRQLTRDQKQESSQGCLNELVVVHEALAEIANAAR